ncbi:TonB-dependent receptor [Capnocytophaga felis]|uniref:outer membrane beta-barrel family protein n=1 Tax=Capnocytophaga felis TaxID=2267611 RepID=UPI0012BFFFAC|nr:outer membrane beta-barrel family protein [Capnocytophaga felis]GET49324.1 TonB-dependent receptor [Capnocytophaga felis]
MKTIFSFLFLWVATLSAQEVVLSGVVQNQQQKPAEFINVLLKKDDKVVQGAITDASGKFSVKILKGNYTLILEQFGTELFSKNVSISENTDLGVIKIDEAIQMEGTTVEGRKKLVEQKVDRLVFNVENSVQASGGDALEALKSTPGVQVHNEDISIVGKNGVRVMVNDKIMQLSGEELTNFLKSIASDNIQKIEVITTPPSKYDAEGNAGLINIVLKKAKENNWNTTLRTSYQQGIEGKSRSGINFSYRKNKFSALADLGYTDGKGHYENDIHFWYPQEYWVNRLETKDKVKTWSPLLNLNYDITNKSAFGVQFIGTFFENTSDHFTANRAYLYNNPKLIKEYITHQITPQKIQNLSVNVNFLQKIGDKGAKLTIDTDYFHYKRDRNGDLNTIFHNYLLNTQPKLLGNALSMQQIDNYSFKTDVEIPISWGNLSFGAKLSRTQTDNIAQSDFRDENQIRTLTHNDHFIYTEDTQALYADWAKSFGKKWSVKAGVRGENTQTKGVSVLANNETHKRNFFKLFPTLYVQYQINENHSISASVNRRIFRPQFFSLNPGRQYINPKSYVVGNPFLLPSYSLGATLNYSFKNWLTLRLSYSDTEDSRTQITYHNPALEETQIQWENFANSNQWSASMNINKNLFWWWEVSASMVVTYEDARPYVAVFPDKMTSWRGYQNLHNTFMLNENKTLQASVSYEYQFPWDDNTRKLSESSSLDFGIKYLTFDKKLTLALNINDILKTDIMTFTAHIEKQGITESYRQYYDTRYLRLSLTYKFGNSKISVQKREGGNAEERNRS